MNNSNENFADMKIFPDELFSETIKYQSATELLNNDGRFYDEYGLHNTKYSIDAIFYNGYKNTKVFAYVGIPKNRETEKLPAVVLLHDGWGACGASMGEEMERCRFYCNCTGFVRRWTRTR